MAGRFDGRVAVVTGGVSGIGRAIAARLVAEGAKLAVWDRDAAALAGAAALFGVPVHTVALDLVDVAAVQAAADGTVAALGGIDILVASAGITGSNHPSWEYPLEDWRRVMAVNVDGVYFCNRAVVPHMRRTGYGRIVNIASIAGKEGNPNAVAYSASKAAVIGMTKSIGKELVEGNIRVNCVAPAAVHTPIFDQMSQAQIAFMLSKIPLGRFGTTEEVAALVCWLCSEEASFSTGAVFDCTGGRATY